VTRGCEFATVRLLVEPWNHCAENSGVDLPRLVAGMLTESTTRELPQPWRGDYSAERARSWIDERERESPTLLAVHRESGQPVGILIVFENLTETSSVDVRIGYLITEAAWGQGFATELVGGLSSWARAQPSIHTLTGGVASTNRASARVLVKNGFERTISTGGEDVYQLNVERDNDPGSRGLS